MSFFDSKIDVLKTLVIALGAGLAIRCAINLPEGYSNDNPGANAQCSQGSNSEYQSAVILFNTFPITLKRTICSFVL